MNTSARRFTTGASTLLQKVVAEKTASSTPRQSDDRLYRRLSALGHVKGTVASTIDAYLREGKVVRKFELETCVRELRKYKRYQHALEIMEWMEGRKFNFGNKDHAKRLDLTAKAEGISAAESYFNGLPPSSKVHCAYGALLNCYCGAKMLDKALDIFKKMVQENMISTPLPFNNLMSLYTKLGQLEKVVVLAEEMKKHNIKPDIFTYHILINSYSLQNDIEGVERVFEEMHRQNAKQCKWTTYSNLAAVYVRVGYRERAELALKNLEKVMPKDERQAYHFLISLYAGISDHNVHRIWKSLKSRFTLVTNKSYLIMIQALIKLNDINAVKKCYEEWDSVCQNYDARLAKAVVRALLTAEMVEEAKGVLERACERSKGSCFIVWEKFMVFFLEKNQVKEALEMMETAASKVRDGKEWHPRSYTVDAFISYLKTQSDVDSAEEFYRLMKQIKCVDGDVYKVLLETYVGAGKTADDIRQRIEGDEIVITSDLQHLLGIVCPEERMDY